VSSTVDIEREDSDDEDDAHAADATGVAPPRHRLSRPQPTKPKRQPSRARLFLRATLRRLAMRFGAMLVTVLSRTWRVSKEGYENLEAAKGEGGGHFIALWHGRMLIPMAHHRHTRWTVLVSQSRDGDLTEELLKGYGFRVIRGSSSKGGARALREMIDALKRGEVLAITPDGPRGPMHSMSPGLVWMARATGYSVVPAGFVADRAWRMKSWDRFTVPKLFARVSFVYGAPIAVPRRATNAELESVSLAIKDALVRTERRAFELVGLERDP
jgi:lysophospholipid acyltransferase (LPLAT)-like uncharacterized protein